MNPVVVNHAADRLHIVLGEELDIAQAGALHGTLTAALDATAPILLDGAQVQRLDTAVLQLLHAFVRSAHRRGLSVEWQAYSEPLAEGARLVGLALAVQAR